MYYKIRHLTRFQYSAPISQTFMELRMHPRTELNQRCFDFQCAVTPRAGMHSYRDFLANTVHHFGIPGVHRQLQVIAESIVEVTPPEPFPDSLPPDAWDALDGCSANGEYYDMLLPSHFAKPTALLRELMAKLDARRRDNPLSLALELNTRLYDEFDYAPQSTRVDSPIDHALSQRKGVCQDFAHIMIAMMRSLHIPARYVSGYLYHGSEDQDRSSDGATHAWVEVLIPGFGWLGLDPTNNLIAGQRHIRTAVGRDYMDVPPTNGVFLGEADTNLSVSVTVTACAELPPELMETALAQEQFAAEVAMAAAERQELEQQQQQQQQQQ